jgi:hypothetical protein
MTLKPKFLLLFALLVSAFAPAQTAVPVVLAPVPQLQFFDQSGRPLAFGCVFAFQSQTTTPLDTFTDFTGQFANQNPVILTAGGSANIWLKSGQAYSLTVKSSGGDRCSLGQTLYTVDGVGGGASQLNTVVTPSGGSAAFTVQSQNQLFSLTLTGNVAGSPVSFIGVIAPALVTFQITEDGGGSHTFSWPSNVIGAAAIDTTANHSTSQTFIWNGTTIMPVGSGFNSAGNTLFAGSVSPVLTANLNNVIAVDGCLGVASPKYACSPAGIQAAITQAQANGTGKVTLPPTNGTPLAMGSTTLNLASNVDISGAGKDITVLQWTSSVNAFLGGVGLQNATLENLTISFSSAACNGAGIRLSGNDGVGNLVWYNHFKNIHMIFTGCASGATGVGIFGNGVGAGTDIVLNDFHDIWVDGANQFASCNSCEGNFWDEVFCQNCGWNSGSSVFSFTGLEADELINARIESGSGNVTGMFCLGINTTASGYSNQVRLTCDTSLSGWAAVFEGGTATYNTFDIGVVENNSTPVGTITAGSQYRYVNGSLGTSTSQSSHPTISGGVSADGGGLKHKRVASCTTAASGNATCATTVTWTTAFADANYTLSCTLIGPGTAFVLESSTPIAASATVTIMNAPGSTTAASGTLDCVAVHD